jgi:hypothetical protein
MSYRPIATEAARVALINVGVTEVGGDNRGQWVETYQRAVGIPPGSPWCAAFVRYRLEAAAEKLDREIPTGFPDTGWVPSYVEWSKANKLWVAGSAAKADPSLVRPGDLVAYWFQAKGRCAHIGIVVEQPTSTGFVAVEGNTGPDSGTTIERDGDGVYRKQRTWSSVGTGGGFIRINF